VAFSPDGKRIVTGGYDKTATVCEAASGKELLTLKGHSAAVVSVAFSPDGNQIATASEDATVRLWDAVNGQELRTIKGHNRGVSSVAFSPNGKRLVTGSGDKTAKVWDIADEDFAANKGLAAFMEYMKRRHLSTPVAFSRDGQRIAASDAQQLRLWDAASGRELLALKSTNVFFSLALSPDAQRIFTGQIDATAQVWDAVSGKQLVNFKGHTNWISSVDFSPNGRHILTCADDGARVWEADSGRELFTISGHRQPDWPAPAGMPIINSANFSPDGQRILTRGLGGTFEVWDAGSGQELFALKGIISSAAYSTDGQRIVSWNLDGTATVWEAASGKELFTLGTPTDRRGPHTLASRTGTAAVFSPDGQRIVTGSTDNTAKVWDAVSGKELLTLKGHSGHVECVAFTPDGQRILTVSDDQTAKLWDAASGREVLTLAANAGSSYVAFSPDGRWIFAGSNGKAEKAWDAARPEQVAQWQAEEAAAVEQ
jgi:WD40 repeat protein